jgi:predicted nucleotidyltransferase component of viral defense system
MKAASIRAKLLELSKSKNISFQVLIYRFLHERLLYRLSQSDYRGNFILKGGNLIYAFENLLTRPTKDVDFLGLYLSNDQEMITEIFKEILQVTDKEDAVWFNPDSIQTEAITELNKYSGVRVFFEGGFDRIRQKIQVDIGFGDVVYPELINIDFPLLVPKLNSVLIKAYSKESVIAEKFHAIITLSYTNSRMKDFYDLFVLLTTFNFDLDVLSDAIIATFKHRETPILPNPSFFEKEFMIDKTLNSIWNRFLKNNNLTIKHNFESTVTILKMKINPVWQSVLQKTSNL